MNTESLGQILAGKRKNLKFKQADVVRMLKERFGIESSVHAISHWEKDASMPSAKQFLALCEIYQIGNMNEVFHVYTGNSPIFLLNDEGREKVYEYASILVKSGLYEPVKEKVIPFRRQLRKYHLRASAGTGQYVDSDAYDLIEVGDEVSSLADFGITLAGNSMEPQFVNGQTVWVHSQETLENGEIGIFYYNGDSYCKKYLEKDGRVYLISLNPGYAPIAVEEGSSFKIFGKVVG